MTDTRYTAYKEQVFTLEKLDYWFEHGDECWLPKYWEIVEGKILDRPPTPKAHGRAATNIIRLLQNYIEENDLGDGVLILVGCIIEEEPLTVRSPDLSFVTKDRENDCHPIDFFNGAPDLAIEVLAPTDDLSLMEAKVEEYLTHKGQLVWLVDPKLKEVKIYRPGGTQPQTLAGDDTITGETVIPGFSCKVSEFFE